MKAPPWLTLVPDPALENVVEEAAAGGQALGPGLEASLVAAARGGDFQAYECLVRTHRHDLILLAARLLGDRRGAPDAVDDALALAWRRLPSLDDPWLFRAWLYHIMTRQCLQVLRQRSSRPATPTRAGRPADSADRADHADPAVGPGLSAIDTALSRALSQLPPDQRNVWTLRELHHRSYIEIARTTGASVSTVRGRLARARRRLPAALASWQ